MKDAALVLVLFQGLPVKVHIITLLSFVAFVCVNFITSRPEAKTTACPDESSSSWILTAVMIVWIVLLHTYFFICNCLINVSVWKYACPVVEFYMSDVLYMLHHCSTIS